MHNLKFAAALVLAFLTPTAGPALAAGKPTRFWNLTSSTVTELRLAPAGTEAFGENQCLNDKDNGVEHDERLKLAGVETGLYDAKIGFEDGRVCREALVDRGRAGVLDPGQGPRRLLRVRLSQKAVVSG
jgi:hypothetical protein